MSQRNSNSRKRRKVASATQRTESIDSYQPDQTMTVKYRYSLLESANDPQEFITELPIAPFGVSATNVINLPFKAVRLAKVRMWANYRPDKSIIENTISLGVMPRTGCRPFQLSDTATFSRTAYLSHKFDKHDPAGFWYQTQLGQANPEIEFTLTKGALLELTLQYILSDEAACSQFSHAGAVQTRVYTNSLSSVHRVIGKDNTYCIPLTM